MYVCIGYTNIMKLIVGLGNIGEEYINTRHNIGFMFLDYLVSHLNLNDYKNNLKLNCLIAKTKDYIFIKPTTYMNDSGNAVQKVKNYYSLKLNDILVIHDDIDQILGNYKFVHKGGSGGHRGVESIKKCLNTDEFNRIKIGIAPEFYNPSVHKAEDFVLKKFTNAELLNTHKIFFDLYNKFFEQIS